MQKDAKDVQVGERVNTGGTILKVAKKEERHGKVFLTFDLENGSLTREYPFDPDQKVDVS